jgi:hypothetical protein
MVCFSKYTGGQSAECFEYLGGIHDGNSLSFGEGLGVKAIGLSLTTGAGVPPPDYELTVSFGDDTQTVVDASGNKFYRGFLASERIKSIVIDSRSDIGWFKFEIDNVSRGIILPVVPETRTLILCGVVLVGIVGTRSGVFRGVHIRSSPNAALLCSTSSENSYAHSSHHERK